jgi:hypothetical protein
MAETEKRRRATDEGAEAREAGIQMPSPFEPKEFADFNNRNMEIASRAARAYFDGAAQMNREISEFLNQRMHKDFECCRLLMNSKNSNDAFSAQSDFVTAAMKDYAEETSRIFNLAAGIAREALKPQSSD